MAAIVSWRPPSWQHDDELLSAWWEADLEQHDRCIAAQTVVVAQAKQEVVDAAVAYAVACDEAVPDDAALMQTEYAMLESRCAEIQASLQLNRLEQQKIHTRAAHAAWERQRKEHGPVSSSCESQFSAALVAQRCALAQSSLNGQVV